ncbi:DUF4190 domain-containing protein [Microbacterium abyssi]|uniref:DUF4190 domain-containing protein n=1 Tax=Microbacterium abyssi TaxID=2782166 RepID=UPI00188860E2|nr:DUF4190 domain-containing protein [Microbacterium sp. A18JL241]
MSDDNTTPGEHPTFPPVPPANPAAAPQAYPGAPAAPQQYQAQQYPAPQHQGQQYAAPQYPAQPYAPARPTSGLAVTSLITGIAGIVFSWTFVALLASIAAVVTGHMALKQTRSNSAVAGRGMAIAGLITGYAGVAIIALLIVIGIFSFLFLGSLPFLLYGVS